MVGLAMSSGTPAGWRAAKRVVAALLVGLLPTACVSGDAGSSQDTVVIAPGESLFGNYLAGRHAQAMREMSTAADFVMAALEDDPGNSDLLRRGFLLMVLDGRMEEALALAGRVAEVNGSIGNGETPIADIVLVVDDIRAGRFDAAATKLSGLPDEGLNAFLKPLIEAWTLVGLDKPDEALKALEALAKRDGFKAMYELHAALINESAGRMEAAEEHFMNAADTPTGLSVRLVELLGGLFERTGRVEEARGTYRMYLEQHPNSQLMGPALSRLDSGAPPTPAVTSAVDGVAEALFGVASSIRRQNAQDTALIFGNMALYMRPGFPLAKILVADILEVEAQLEKANAVYASIDPSSPFSWSARLRIASNLDDLDRTEEAEKQLRAMAAEQPEKSEPLINLGDILRGHEKFVEAVQAYDQGIARIEKLEKRHWSVLYARGIALERSKQWSRAEADFLKALEFEPEQPYVLNYLGYSWVDQGKHLEQAQEMIKKAVKLRPNDGYIVDSLGWVLYRLGDYEGAARELERAVELRPEDPVINDHLGDAYWKVGRRQEAPFQWRRALSLDPDPGLLAKIEAKLERGLVEEPTAGGND